jgi:hypothetical protein
LSRQGASESSIRSDREGRHRCVGGNGIAQRAFSWTEVLRRLPGYCRRFDIAILPFAVNELTLNANPLKLREYLAAGLPVVSTAIPEVERFGRLVRLGRSADDFLAHLDQLLALKTYRTSNGNVSRDGQRIVG